MKKAIKLVLIYFIMQALGMLTSIPLSMIFLYATTGTVDEAAITAQSLSPSLLLGFVYMAWYLQRKGYLKNDGFLYSRLSTPYLMYSLLAGLSTIVWIDALMTRLTFLPNWMEQSFDVIQNGWLGILCISLLGPILEEVLFRGAVTRELLKKYRPTKAILISALIFGLFHINPVQVVGAFFSGLLFAWLYYKSRSLVPGILIHVVNNSFSVWSTTAFPDAQYINELMNRPIYWSLLAVTAFVLVISLKKLNDYETMNIENYD